MYNMHTPRRGSMTHKDLREAIEMILPGAQLDEDFNGQIIVYADLMIGDDGELVDYCEDEE